MGCVSISTCLIQVRLYQPGPHQTTLASQSNQRIDFKVIILMFKAFYVNKLLITSWTCCKLVLDGDNLDLIAPAHHTLLCQERVTSLLLIGHKLWNKLQNFIRDTTSFNTLTTFLTAHLFQEAYHQWLIYFFCASAPLSKPLILGALESLTDWLTDWMNTKCPKPVYTAET